MYSNTANWTGTNLEVLCCPSDNGGDRRVQTKALTDDRCSVRQALQVLITDLLLESIHLLLQLGQVLRVLAE